MDREEFEKKLKECDLNKKKFANKTGIAYQTIINWGSTKVPSWVESWLQNYIKSKFYEEIKDKVYKIEEG